MKLMDRASVRTVFAALIFLLQPMMGALAQEQQDDAAFDAKASQAEEERLEGVVAIGEDDSNMLAALPPNTYMVESLADQSCMTASGTQIIETSCYVPSNYQYWYYNYVGSSGGNNYYNLINYATGACLDVVGGSYADGARLTTTTCCQQCTSQWWRQQNALGSSGYSQIRNLPSGKCIDLPLVPGSTNQWNGDPIGQWSCGSYREGRGANQFWSIRSY